MYVKQIWDVVTENLLDPMKVLLKQLFLESAEQQIKQIQAIQISTHLTPCLKFSHLFPDVCDPAIVCDKVTFSSHSLEQNQ